MNVSTLSPGVAGPIPIWPWPLTSGGGSCALHVTANVVVAVPPAGTVTVRGFAPPTTQFAATPDSATGCAPAATATVTLPFVTIGRLVVPSTVRL